MFIRKQGNAEFVPPPSNRLMECLDPFENFLHDDSESLPLLARLGLIHLQFETIHPFPDGNGRVGRLLTTLLLCEKKALREPLLYLSLYFKTHRQHYYDLLQRVRTDGAWELWLEFFLEGIESTAEEVCRAVTRSLALFAKDRKQIAVLGPTLSLEGEISSLKVWKGGPKAALVLTNASATERVWLGFYAWDKRVPCWK